MQFCAVGRVVSILLGINSHYPTPTPSRESLFGRFLLNIYNIRILLPLPPLFGCFLLNIYNIRILLPLPPLFGCFLLNIYNIRILLPLPPLFGCFLLNIYNIRILLPLPPLFGCFLYTSEFFCHCPLQSNIPFSSDFCTV